MKISTQDKYVPSAVHFLFSLEKLLWIQSRGSEKGPSSRNCVLRRLKKKTRKGNGQKKRDYNTRIPELLLPRGETNKRDNTMHSVIIQGHLFENKGNPAVSYIN